MRRRTRKWEICAQCIVRNERGGIGGGWGGRCWIVKKIPTLSIKNRRVSSIILTFDTNNWNTHGIYLYLSIIHVCVRMYTHTHVLLLTLMLICLSRRTLSDVGTLAKDGSQFDSSRDPCRGAFQFKVGVGQVIKVRARRRRRRIFVALWASKRFTHTQTHTR